MAEQSKVRQELTEQFLAALEQQQLPWEKGWGTEAPINPTTGSRYRGVNRLMLGIMGQKKGYQDPRWCTYIQAQEQGWQVRKGEKAARVEYWCCYDKTQKKYIDWDKVKDLVKDDPAYEKNLSLRCRVYAVFNGAQIDGIPKYEQAPGIELGALRSKRDTLLQNMAVGFREGGDRAFYSPGLDTITLPPERSFYTGYDYMSTLLHEAGHATGHESRLNRHIAGGFGSPEYAREELRAEIASAFVSQELGLPGGQSHVKEHTAYIQDWIAVLNKDPDELFRAISDAQGIADYLMEKGQFLELEQAQSEKVTAPTEQPQEAPKPQQAENPMSRYLDRQLDEGRLKQVQAGLAHGLSPEKLDIYAKPVFSVSQMYQLRTGLENGLELSQVAAYAKPELDEYQMSQMRHSLEKGPAKGQAQSRYFSFALGDGVITVQAGSEQEAALKALEQLDAQAQAAPQNQAQQTHQAPKGPKLTM